MALYELLGHFARAATDADRRYLHTHDAGGIEAGIEVWEELVAAGGLADAPGEALVDAYVSVATLYTRRHEVAGRAADLSLALRYLQEARRHVCKGSFADLQAGMARAACLLQRYRADRQPEDLDSAIAGWAALLGSEAGALAAANLGRALLERSAATGDRGDLAEGRRLLGLASAQMPRDHPSRPEVELALRAAG